MLHNAFSVITKLQEKFRTQFLFYKNLGLKGIRRSHLQVSKNCRYIPLSINVTDVFFKTLMELSQIFHYSCNPFSANFTKWPNTLKHFVDNLPTNCLGVFDHFAGLALKGLILCFLQVLLYTIKRNTLQMITFTLVNMTLLKCVVSALQEDMRPYLNSFSSSQTIRGPCLNRPYHFKFLKGCLPEI